jgi:hypothetical protein
VRRTLIAGFMGVVLLTGVLLAPAAGASTDRASTVCRMNAKLTYKPPLEKGENQNAFFKVAVKLHDCTGGVVSSATGQGGAAGELVCTDGQVSGTAALKIGFDWDTGDETAINAFIDFDTSSFPYGEVVFGLFNGERVRAHFHVRPVKGDCSSTPLVRSLLRGRISF